MIYLDTSAAVPLFVAEPASERIDAWLAVCDEALVSSDWIVTEFASALAIKERAGALPVKSARAAWRSFENFCRTGLRLTPIGRQVFPAAAKLVRQAQGLRAGDALHLAAALGIGVRGMATLDALLGAHAQRLGLAVVKL